MSIAHPKPQQEEIDAQKAGFDAEVQDYLTMLTGMSHYPGADNVISKSTSHGPRLVLEGASSALVARVVFEGVRHSKAQFILSEQDVAAVLKDSIEGNIPDLELQEKCLVWNRGEGISVMVLEALGFNDEWLQAFEKFHGKKVGKIYFKLGFDEDLELGVDEDSGEETTDYVPTLVEDIENICRRNPGITVVDVLEMSTRSISDIQKALGQGKLKGLNFFRTSTNGFETIVPDIAVESLYSRVHDVCAEATGDFMRGEKGQPCASEGGKDETPVDPKNLN